MEYTLLEEHEPQILPNLKNNLRTNRDWTFQGQYKNYNKWPWDWQIITKQANWQHTDILDTKEFTFVPINTTDSKKRLPNHCKVRKI